MLTYMNTHPSISILYSLSSIHMLCAQPSVGHASSNTYRKVNNSYKPEPLLWVFSSCLCLCEDTFL